jgi:hypothetical protein
MSINDRTTRSRSLVVSVAVAALAVALVGSVATAASPKTKLANQSTGGVQATDDDSIHPDITGGGRHVVFDTGDDDMVGGDGNDDKDVFIRDFKNGTTKLVSVAFGGGVGNKNSERPTISTSGQFVAYTSEATDLIAGGTNGKWHIFVRNRWGGKTELLSQSNGHVQGNDTSDDPSISGNGRWVAFESRAGNLVGKDTKGVKQIYLYDRKNDRIQLVSRNNGGAAGNGGSEEPSVSKDGRFVAYNSVATNLTPKNTKGFEQVYRYDRIKKKNVLLSRNKAGRPGNGDSDNPAISGDGKKAVYNSNAKNLLGAGKDTNKAADAYMRNFGTGKTTRVSLNWKGRQLNSGGVVNKFSDPDISLNGRWVAFESSASNAVKGGSGSGFDQIYARNLLTGTVKLISKRASKGNAESDQPILNTNGKFVAFETAATNLIAGGDANASIGDVLRRGPIH